jgi:uncharacterized protein (DUF2342 family)
VAALPENRYVPPVNSPTNNACTTVTRITAESVRLGRNTAGTKASGNKPNTNSVVHIAPMITMSWASGECIDMRAALGSLWECREIDGADGLHDT